MTEMVFPNNDVRFIAVNNGVDSVNGTENDMTPFINLFNEFYAKDTSRKIRAVSKAKGTPESRSARIRPTATLKIRRTRITGSSTKPPPKWSGRFFICVCKVTGFQDCEHYHGKAYHESYRPRQGARHRSIRQSEHR